MIGRVPSGLGQLLVLIVVVLLFVWVGFTLHIFPLDWLTHPGR